MNRLPRPRATLLALLILTGLLLQACGAQRAATPDQPQIILTLLDLSGSTEAVRENYLAQVERIIAAVPPGGRLVILPVSARSLTAPAALDLTLPAYTWWKTNSFTHGRAVNRLRQQALETVAALLEQNPGTRGTALIDSLLQAQAFLKEYPEGAGAIYIISDMVEQSDLLDLYGLEQAGVEPALAKVSEAERMPALNGAAVTVAGLEAAGHLPSAQVLAIKSFWEGLLESAGARLLWYSPTLKLPDQL